MKTAMAVVIGTRMGVRLGMALVIVRGIIATRRTGHRQSAPCSLSIQQFSLPRQWTSLGIPPLPLPIPIPVPMPIPLITHASAPMCSPILIPRQALRCHPTNEHSEPTRARGGKRSSIVEISVSRLFIFWGLSRVTFIFGISCVFFKGNFFGVSHLNFFFGVSRVWEKKPFFPKKKKSGETQEPLNNLHCYRRVKHIAPTFWVPPARVKRWSCGVKGGFYTHRRHMAEITWSALIMTANKKCNLPFGLWQAVSK